MRTSRKEESRDLLKTELKLLESIRNPLSHRGGSRKEALSGSDDHMRNRMFQKHLGFLTTKGLDWSIMQPERRETALESRTRCFGKNREKK